jgi:hypothetical protein
MAGDRGTLTLISGARCVADDVRRPNSAGATAPTMQSGSLVLGPELVSSRGKRAVPPRRIGTRCTNANRPERAPYSMSHPPPFDRSLPTRLGSLAATAVPILALLLEVVSQKGPGYAPTHFRQTKSLKWATKSRVAQSKTPQV